MVDLLTGSNTLSDGTSLFHASRDNVLTQSAGEELDLLGEARRVLRGQRNLDGTTPIQVTPKFVVCGADLGIQVERILDAIQPNETAAVNPFAGKLQLLLEPRLEGDSWYVFADPAQCAVFSAAPGPQIQRQDAWNTLAFRSAAGSMRESVSLAGAAL